MVFKGTLSGAATTTYTPAADRGHTYKVDTAGLINGIPVEVGDTLICTTDSTAAATSSTVDTINANWVILQTNIDGAVITTQTSSTSGSLAVFTGTGGKTITKVASAGTSTKPIYIDSNGLPQAISSYEGKSGSAGYAASAARATYSGSAGYAASAARATYSASSTWATSSGSAGYASSAAAATFAASAGHALTAGSANTAGSSNSAARATYAASAGYAASAAQATHSASADFSSRANFVGKGSHTAAVTANEFTPQVGDITVVGNVSNTTMSHTNNANAEMIIKTHPTSDTNYYEARLGFSSDGSLYYMPVNTNTWKTVAYTTSDITGKAGSAGYAASAAQATHSASAAYATNAGTASTATRAVYAASAGYSASAAQATHSASATWAMSAGSAGYAASAAQATHSASAGYAASAGSASSAAESTHSACATWAMSASSAGYAANAGNATNATESTHSASSTWAMSAGSAGYASSAARATYSASAGYTLSSGSAGYASSAAQATHAASATWSMSGGSAGYAASAAQATHSASATWAMSAGSAGYAASAAQATHSASATWAMSAGSAGYAASAAQATHSASATYSLSAGSAGYAASAAQATHSASATYSLSAGSAGYAASAAQATHSASAGYSATVAQNAVITTNAHYPILFGTTTQTTAISGALNKASNLLFNPSTKVLSVSAGQVITSTFSGALYGTAACANYAASAAQATHSASAGYAASAARATYASNAAITTTANAIAKYSNTSGAFANTSVLIDGSNNVSMPAALSVTGATTHGGAVNIVGNTTVAGSFIGGSSVYGNVLPSTGVEGQIFFQLSDSSTPDSRYVLKAGDTMTGQLAMNVTGTYPITLAPWGGNYGTAGTGQLWYCGTNASQSGYKQDAFYFGSTGNQKIVAGEVWGAVWNDYAEFREADTLEPGRCIKENGNDTLSLTTERLERGCEIISDTFGFAIGETEKAKTPVATTGRVLAYPYESKEEFAAHIGWPVCSGPNGTVSIMTKEEEEKYPSRIIGIISAVPEYDIWHCGGDKEKFVEVNGRVWIRVR